MRLLGLIPARGGSKGIPHKNIYELNGKPLIAYSIIEGLKAREKGAIEDLVVTTDDRLIADISKQYGASVPFMRPREFSEDGSKSVDCMIHAADFFSERGEKYDAILLLQPTSPLRTAEDIIKSAEMYKNNSKESLISCYKEESISEYNIYHLDGNVAIPFNEEHNKGKRRQDIEPLYVRNGAIFITDIQYMKRTRLVIGNSPLIYVMPKERSINIDTELDMKEAEWLISR